MYSIKYQFIHLVIKQITSLSPDYKMNLVTFGVSHVRVSKIEGKVRIYKFLLNLSRDYICSIICNILFWFVGFTKFISKILILEQYLPTQLVPLKLYLNCYILIWNRKILKINVRIIALLRRFRINISRFFSILPFY